MFALLRIKVYCYLCSNVRVQTYSGHYYNFSGDSVLAEAVQLLQKACSKLLEDEEFYTTDSVRSNIKIYNTYISGID